jgi:AcrR family transcriptional regulator
LAQNEKQETTVKRDPEGVRRDILRVASAMFAEGGLSGTKIDEIAAKTTTSKRMIYYYFGDKEGLYQACLEAAYAYVRSGEEALDLTDLPADEALAKVVAFTFDHHRANPDFIRMVMIENIHKARFLQRSDKIRTKNRGAIETLAGIIAKGQQAGLFRKDLDPVELHWQISALSFFNVSNRHTFGSQYGEALYEDAGQEALRDHTVQMVLSYVKL